MIYLGEQEEALGVYSNEAVCFLSIKLKGRLSKTNKKGYKCADDNCHNCNTRRKNTKINSNFRKLFTTSRIKGLICSTPQELIDLYGKIESEYIAPDNLKENSFKEQCQKLFVTSGYTGWFGEEDKKVETDKWNYRLAKLLNKHTCTYCNREYTFVYRRKGKGMVPQFDHWFPKEKKPLLAISFYNLIPSCATCNAIKSNEEFNLKDHLHPYVDKEISNSYKFDYIFKETHVPEILLKNNTLLGNKGKNTFDALNLPFIYKGHSDKELKDLYDLRFKYSENYLESLIKNTFGNHLPISDKEKYRLIFGIELEAKDYHKRIMSKFKGDIIEKLLSISTGN